MISEFLNSNNVNRTLSEVLTGAGHLTWASPGKTLTINTGQAFTGNTTAANTGIISIGDGGNVGGPIISNSTVIFSQTTNKTFNNALGGTGIFTKNSNTIMVLTGANTFSGTFQNLAGTLQLGDGTNTVSMGTGNILNNGAVISNKNGPLTISGVISGTGTFAKQNLDVTILSANNTYTGTTTIIAGILQIGDGGASGGISGPIVNNANLVFDRSGTYSSAIPSGAGTTRIVSGTYAMGSGGDNFMNATTGTMTVEAGATFSASANGILELGHSNYTLNGNANITFQSFFRMVFNGNFFFNAVGGGTFTRNASSGGSNFLPNVMNFTTNGGARCNWVINTQANSSTTITFNIALGTDLTSDFLVSGSSGMNGSSPVVKSGLGRLQFSTSNSYSGTTTINAGTLIISNTTGLGNGATSINSGGTLTYTVSTTGTRTVTVNAGGVVNRGGFAHTGTTFVNNGGTINP
jgi:autotransporter-associated beta strand protein